MRLAISFSLLFMNVNPAQTIHKEPKSLTIFSIISIIYVPSTRSRINAGDELLSFKILKKERFLPLL